MRARAESADLIAYMNAYAVLEVEYSSTATDIRRAYRRLAQQAHPDRHPQNSAEQRSATARMATINDAYDLIRNAPLRHHPVSRRSHPDVVWSDSQLDAALRSARAERVTLDIVAVCAMGAVGVFFSVSIVQQLDYIGLPGFQVYAALIPLLGGLLAAFLGSRFWNVWYLIDTLAALARLVTR